MDTATPTAGVLPVDLDYLRWVAKQGEVPATLRPLTHDDRQAADARRRLLKAGLLCTTRAGWYTLAAAGRVLVGDTTTHEAPMTNAKLMDLAGRAQQADALLAAAVKERFPFSAEVALPPPHGGSGQVIGFLPEEPDQVAVRHWPHDGRSQTVFVSAVDLVQVNPDPQPVGHEQAEAGNGDDPRTADFGGEG